MAKIVIMKDEKGEPFAINTDKVVKVTHEVINKKSYCNLDMEDGKCIVVLGELRSVVDDLNR